MTLPTFGLGLHISLDDVVFNVNAKNALIDHWNACPAVVNNLYATANRLDVTIPLAATWMRTYPQTRWILRLHPDDGNHRKEAFKDPANLYARNKRYHEMGFIVMLDNESAFATPEDAKVYADWTAKYLQLTGDNGHRAAWGRFAAGNIKEAYYPIFKACLVINSRYVDLHEFSPNEYFPSMADDSGSGSMERYRLMWNVATNGIQRPRTSIGEFGLARGYDPQAGFRGAGVSEADYVETLGKKYRKHYQNEGVAVSIFMYPEGVPPWNEMCLSTGALPLIRKIAMEHPDPVVTIPADPFYEVTAKLREGVNTVNLRSEARVVNHPVSNDIGDIHNGDLIGYIWPPVEGQTVEGNNQWVKVRIANGQIGYASMHYLIGLEPPDVPQPEPPVEEPPAPEPEYVTRAEVDAQIATMRQQVIAEVKADTMEFLKAWAAAVRDDVTLAVTTELITRLTKGVVEAKILNAEPVEPKRKVV